MSVDENILKSEEKAVFSLRKLYLVHGYTHYKMNKFEEYDLYSENKDFLASDGIITFTDPDGKLLALKPDVTLSVLKNFRDVKDSVQKLYYNESVYRISENSHTYKEIMQTGLECLGDLTEREIAEVVLLALKSLSVISPRFMLNLSHVGLLAAVLDECGLTGKTRQTVLEAVTRKNRGRLKELCSPEQFDRLKVLIQNHSSAEATLQAVGETVFSEPAKAALAELENLIGCAKAEGFGDHIRLDFSAADSAAYYSGVVFKGYLNGLATRVLSGGRYDGLMRKMGGSAGAIGFAVYLDALSLFEETSAEEDVPFVNIALPKGRLGEKVYALFAAAGLECPAVLEPGRKLIFENEKLGLRFFWVKPSDVAIYVERGAADIGVAGKDILMEYEPDVYELLDLRLGLCRMAVAAKKDFCDDPSKTLRVATKFSHIARRYYAEKCRDIELIHLNGSIELAPILGLSDVIVDIVETGKTLLENDLTPIETVAPISARLIANRSAYQFKTQAVEKIRKGLLAEVEKKHD